MEPLFLAVICGCHAGLFREALHEVYIPRIQRGDAYFAAKVLRARGLGSVLAHFFEDGRWGSLVQGGIEGQSLTAEDQLLILMQAGQCLRATRGYGAPEARICYERAEALCHSLGRPLLLCVTLLDQWRNSLMTEKLTAAMQIARRIYSLAQEQNDAALMIEAYNALAMTLFFSGDFESARQCTMHGIQIWHSRGAQSYALELHGSVVTCLCFKAASDWHVGEIASCQATIAEAISLAKELKDALALAAALHCAANLAYDGRNIAAVDQFSSDLIELSTRHNYSYWLAQGRIHRGWARSASGDTTEGILLIEQGIRDVRATGTVLGVPSHLARKAEALYLTGRTSEALEAIDEAEALAERFEHRNPLSKLHRLRAVFLAALGADEARIEAAFQEAIRIAKQQKSISQRAEATYAEYCRQKASASGGRGIRLPLW
jgi:tetratricopeptide (TPR) repeat protein